MLKKIISGGQTGAKESMSMATKVSLIIFIVSCVLFVSCMFLYLNGKSYATTTYSMPDGSSYIRSGGEFNSIDVLYNGKLENVSGTVVNPKETFMQWMLGVSLFQVFVLPWAWTSYCEEKFK